MDLIFRSELPETYRNQIERLVFFNEHQNDVQGSIMKALVAYGTPEIAAGLTGLRLTLSRCSDVQCLFALMPKGEALKLVGVAVYMRRSLSELVVVHIAVAKCGPHATNAGRHIASAMIRAVRQIAQRLRGVERLTVFYGRGRHLAIGAARSSLQPV